ncbi:autotransporter-associated beta strand repeat-containing protein [Cerasicoccus arenae]|uniref:PEP-CTERM protein-sorting domain-containing protein n=1 Tax=Cerasicoccus arenae TaxID=424488 RepID=A0A8J3DAD8_9BACT|nr:autotransporter-associated beta strand repeat-containing protein [Cerasicoccus arenae]MBK1859248.1 autotransporter-associated beta strand repeat-containing protein [Cerasicoccus arenae]GHC01724.1 hypothetical protein GCM10007047_17890 [Cerasicoccus arenae]
MKKPIPHTLTLSLITVALHMATAPSLQAVNYTWNNSGTDWNSDASWNSSSGTFPNSGGDLAIFSSSAANNPHINSSISISRMTANSSSASGYTLSSSNAGVSLTLGSNGTGISSAINYTPTVGIFTIDAPIIFGASGGTTQSVNVNSASSSVFGNVIINGAVTTPNAITLNKSGTGWLTLTSASNAWSGDIQVSDGTLALSGAGILGSGNLLMNSGTFDLSGISSGSFNHSASLLGTGSIVGGGKTLGVNGLNPNTNLALDDVTLSLSGTSIFGFSNPTFQAGTFDTVIGVDSSVEFSGTLELNFSGGIYSIGSSAQIFNAQSYTGDFSDIDFTGLDVGQSATFNPLTGTVTIIPEANSYALLFGCGTFLFLFWKRRKN